QPRRHGDVLRHAARGNGRPVQLPHLRHQRRVPRRHPVPQPDRDATAPVHQRQRRDLRDRRERFVHRDDPGGADADPHPNPRPTPSAGAALPAGAPSAHTHDGTATLSGTPQPGTGGTYPLTLRAVNSVAPDATQAFTLTVNQPPALTSAAGTTVIAGATSSFTV